MKKIILASGSPRRRELLTQIGIDFDVVTSNAEEIITKTYPQDIVCELSCLKAKAVYDMLKEPQKDIDNSVIIGADTIVYCDGEILGKPADNDDAYRMIKKSQEECIRSIQELHLYIKEMLKVLVKRQMYQYMICQKQKLTDIYRQVRQLTRQVPMEYKGHLQLM